MAQSITGVCNGALERLGNTSIMNITDDGREARLCRGAYDDCRRRLLRDHNWNFAIKRVALAPDTAAPEFGFTYQFTLPMDCLKVLVPVGVDWVVEGRKVLTNLSNVLYLRYIVDVEDATQFDALFYDLFSVSVAQQICEALTGSDTKLQRLDAEYKETVAKAKRANAFEKQPGEQPEDAWLAARRR